MSTATTWADIRWRERDIRIEYRWIGARDAQGPGQEPLVVFLHEGLGSIAMWRDFPDRFCAAVGCRGLVYSRPGYGRSTPRAPDDQWDVDFMHRQAREVLPALLQALKVQERPWLLGHSDGGSIALLYAAAFPASVAGLVVLAPHIFVEDLSVESIAKTRETYLSTDLRTRLARYHDDVDSAFWGWNDIWLHPPFKDWNIEDELGSITCPILAVQGIHDEYGTLRQIRDIAKSAPQVQLLELPDCGHSPHRDQPEAVIDAASAFIHSHES